MNDAVEVEVGEGQGTDSPGGGRGVVRLIAREML